MIEKGSGENGFDPFLELECLFLVELSATDCGCGDSSSANVGEFFGNVITFEGSVDSILCELEGSSVDIFFLDPIELRIFVRFAEYVSNDPFRERVQLFNRQDTCFFCFFFHC